MRDIRGLAHLAFSLAHEVSEGALDLESSPPMRRHRFLGQQVADAGVSALAHVACASAACPPGGYTERIEATSALRHAVKCMDELRTLLKKAERNSYADAATVETLAAKLEEALAVTRALAAELHGGLGRRGAA